MIVWGPTIYGPGPPFTGSLKARAEEGGSPGSVAQSTNGPREAAEDGAALGWPKAPLRKGAKAA